MKWLKQFFSPGRNSQTNSRASIRLTADQNAKLQPIFEEIRRRIAAVRETSLRRASVTLRESEIFAVHEQAKNEIKRVVDEVLATNKYRLSKREQEIVRRGMRGALQEATFGLRS